MTTLNRPEMIPRSGPSHTRYISVAVLHKPPVCLSCGRSNPVNIHFCLFVFIDSLLFRCFIVCSSVCFAFISSCFPSPFPFCSYFFLFSFSSSSFQLLFYSFSFFSVPLCQFLSSFPFFLFFSISPSPAFQICLSSLFSYFYTYTIITKFSVSSKYPLTPIDLNWPGSRMVGENRSTHQEMTRPLGHSFPSAMTFFQFFYPVVLFVSPLSISPLF